MNCNIHSTIDTNCYNCVAGTRSTAAQQQQASSAAQQQAYNPNQTLTATAYGMGILSSQQNDGGVSIKAIEERLKEAKQTVKNLEKRIDREKNPLFFNDANFRRWDIQAWLNENYIYVQYVKEADGYVLKFQNEEDELKFILRWAE